MDRRNFLAGIIAAATAPAFIKTAGLLMPIKPVIVEAMSLGDWPAGYNIEQQGKVWVATFAIEVETEGMVKIS